MFSEILQNSQENTCARVSQTVVICEISKKTFFTEQLWVTDSVIWGFPWKISLVNLHFSLHFSEEGKKIGTHSDLKN